MKKRDGGKTSPPARFSLYCIVLYCIVLLRSQFYSIGKFITFRGNSAFNCTRKPISHESRSDECDIGFQVQFDAEFTSQVMNFP